jgi:aminomethyltransferase
MDDVKLTNVSDELTALGIAGPKAREEMTAAGFALSDMQSLQIQSVSWRAEECTVVCGESGNWEIWLPVPSVRALWDSLQSAGATPVGFEALEQKRIEAGIPVYGIDIRDRDLPQETEQGRALNFNKGCYIGQEIVERIRSRGAVHRKFTGFLAAGDVAVGSKISLDGKDVGEITSVAALAVSDNKTLALGYIRRETGGPGREVMIGSTKATVVQLPLTPQSFEESSMQQRPA